MKKIYPSSAAKVLGNTVTGYKESCLRYHILPNPPRAEIDQIYKDIGALGETAFEQQYPQVTREVAIKHQLTPDILISGRADGIDYATETVYEVKTTLSKTKYQEVSQRRHLPYNYLAQICTYMVILNYFKGEVHVYYAHYNKAQTKIELELALFKLQIHEDKITINGNLSEISLKDILRYYALAQYAHISKELPPKVISQFACDSCPARNICAQNPKDRDEFFRKVKDEGYAEISSDLMPKPKINSHDIKSRSK